MLSIKKIIRQFPSLILHRAFIPVLLVPYSKHRSLGRTIHFTHVVLQALYFMLLCIAYLQQMI
jgi:hypothetical protein